MVTLWPNVLCKSLTWYYYSVVLCIKYFKTFTFGPVYSFSKQILHKLSHFITKLYHFLIKNKWSVTGEVEKFVIYSNEETIKFSLYSVQPDVKWHFSELHCTCGSIVRGIWALDRRIRSSIPRHVRQSTVFFFIKIPAAQLKFIF